MKTHDNENITAYCASGESSLKDIIKIINENSAQICVVVEKNKPVGVITDGDLRRAFLLGHTLNSFARDIMVKDFICGYESSTNTQIFETMKSNSILQLPIINDSGEFVRLELLSSFVPFIKKTNPVCIMAGGRGTRMGHLTKNVPKPMLTIFGKPILEEIIDKLKGHGITNFYISVNYLKEKITEYFGDGSEFDVHINYLVEKTPLGTCGSLSLLEAELFEPVIVMNGDILTRVNFSTLIDYHELHQSDITVCIQNKDMPCEFGVIELDGDKITGINEKPNFQFFVNTGIYVLNPKIIQNLEKDRYLDMPELIKRIISSGGVVKAFAIHEDWIDIGYPETIQSLNLVGE